MNQISYVLCHKPVIGLLMWITNLCSFPPLIVDEPIALGTAGSTISAAFTAPVDKRYSFDLSFEFPSVEARLRDQIVGDRYDENCQDTVNFQDILESRRVGLGHPIPFRIIIRQKLNSTVVIDRTFTSLCVSSHVDKRKWRTIGGVELARGEYIAEIKNLESQGGLDKVRTAISLVAGHGK